MKLGRKGFMLAEVVVVSVVVSIVLITLYTGLSRVSSAYNVRNKYYDVDSLYVAMEINDILRRDNISINTITTAGEINDIDTAVNSFINFYFNSVGDSVYCYITPYNKDKMLSLKNLNTNLTFSEYLDYLSGNLNFSDENYNYMIIVERIKNNDINDCYYYALKLKY